MYSYSALRQTQHDLHEPIVVDRNPPIPVGIVPFERLGDLLDDHARPHEPVKRDPRERSPSVHLRRRVLDLDQLDEAWRQAVPAARCQPECERQNRHLPKMGESIPQLASVDRLRSITIEMPKHVVPVLRTRLETRVEIRWHDTYLDVLPDARKLGRASVQRDTKTQRRTCLNPIVPF